MTDENVNEKSTAVCGALLVFCYKFCITMPAKVLSAVATKCLILYLKRGITPRTDWKCSIGFADVKLCYFYRCTVALCI